MTPVPELPAAGSSHAMPALPAQRSSFTAQLTNWLVVALLVVTLGAALATQTPGPELSADDSFGTTLVLQKKISDDDGITTDADTSFEAVLASTVHVYATLRNSISTTRHLAAAYLAVVISASPRAPPLPHLS